MKELTIEEIKKEIDAGNNVELDCIDRDGYLGNSINDELDTRQRIIRGDFDVVVIGYDIVGFLLNIGNYRIPYNDLKYFRIKRHYPTFDDLIDVVVQAKKDGIVSEIHWSNDQSLSVLCSDGVVVSATEEVTGSFIHDAINDIKSLYTETFVMEDVSSFLKITEGIQSIVLANGCDITHRVYFDGSSLRFRDGWGDSITLTFDILKGATVTQRKGDK